MKICLVTAFPPSREALNEYGFHIARELQSVPGLELTVLGDEYSPVQPELEGFNVSRCWAFNSLRNPFRLLRAIHQCKPDVVWFNLGFASFGGRPLPAFAGIAIPALARLTGFYTHVTLHQLMETVDLQDAGIRFPMLYRGAGFLATQLILFASSISVLLPAYRSLIRDKYRRGSVYVRRHGILSGRPEYPDFERRGNPVQRVLAFGKWGTYKRLEPMIEAFQTVCERLPNVELVIAGTNHPKAQGYLESVEEKCRENGRIKFIGYVPEEKIGDLFQSISVAVMPYTSSAGSSGVAHLACAYGVPIVASDISDFRQLVEEEGLAIELYQSGNIQSLAEQLVLLLDSPDRQMEMAIQNFSAALRMSMPEIIKQYLRTFRLQQELGALSSASRMRKLPRWFPMRDRLVRAAARKRMARLFAPLPPDSAAQRDSLNREQDGSGTTLGARIALNGDSVNSRRSPGRRGGSSPTTRGEQDEHYPERGYAENPFEDLSSRPGTGEGDGHHSESREQHALTRFTPITGEFLPEDGSRISGRDGHHGRSRGIAWGDRDGQKGTDGSGG
jgi:glycosyltransferase involved in cell wall biosynthesis